MIRIIIFFLWLLLAVLAVSIFAWLDNRIVGEAFGYRFDGPAGLVLGAFVVIIFAAIYLTHLFKSFTTMSSRLKAKERESRRNRGVSALTRGLEAVAAGDASGAAHHAKVARNNLNDVELTRLLTAQAAQLNNDETTARESFSAMLAAPETEFLGLKGLYLQAMAAGEIDKARGYADRAFQLRPNAKWAFDTVFDLGLARGAWGETRNAIEKARKNGVIEGGKADRAIAVLLTADAYAAQLSEDNETALSDVQSALKRAPGLAPAATLAANLLLDAGKTGKASKVVETAFSVAAHPALAMAYEKVVAEKSDDKRVAALAKLAEKNSESDEAVLLRARADILRNEGKSAMEALEPILSKSPTANAFSLMAEAVASEHGAEAARPWLEKAAHAPLDPRPGADGAFHFTRDGWARLVREYMEFERLAPPPLEEASLGMSVDDIRLLAAPPIEPEPAPTEDGHQEPAPESAPEPAVLDDEQPGVEMSLPSFEEMPSSKSSDEKTAAPSMSADDDDHIHNDEEAERAAAAARNVS